MCYAALFFSCGEQFQGKQFSPFHISKKDKVCYNRNIEWKYDSELGCFMNDVYIEQIVVRKPPKSAGVTKVLLILLCILSLVMVVLPYGVGLIAIAAVIAFTVIRFRSYETEYEYSFVEGELDVDRIICKSSRRKCGSFDFKKLELMAPLGSQRELRLSHKKYKEFDYSSGDTEALRYVAYVMKDNETVRLVFEPNEELVAAVNYIARGKVFQD